MLDFLRRDKQRDLGGLRVRKLADKTDGDRIVRFHPETGEKMLVRPERIAAEGFDYATMTSEPWPLAGVIIEGEKPRRCVVSTSFVDRAVGEGWASLVGDRRQHRPGGPPDDPWRVTHTFRHGDVFVLHTLDGDVRYRVAENPDKWPESKNDAGEGFGGDVCWTYLLELEN